MSSKKQEEIIIDKTFGFKRILKSIKFSYDGLVYGYKNEQSMWLHGIGLIFVILLGIFLKLSFNQWALVILSSMFILSIELLNTAIEATVDMVTKEYNPYAKIAKDCGSAAAAVATFAHIAICIFVFTDRIMGLIG